MIDDYKYTPTPLPSKNSGPFGLGGKPNEGSRGFSGNVVDAGPGLAGNPNLGGNFQAAAAFEGAGIVGGIGATGATGPLVSGNSGDMLYHNGSTWVPFAGVDEQGLLRMSSKIPSWFQAGNNGILTSNGNTNQFEILSNLANSILGTNSSNELVWKSEIPDGYTYGDMLFWDGVGWSIISAPSSAGISVLASSGGTPYWIETQDC